MMQCDISSELYERSRDYISLTIVTYFVGGVSDTQIATGHITSFIFLSLFITKKKYFLTFAVRQEDTDH